ncbi:hypothetical protein BKA70DRAFT_1337978 [Coprinopsis sp. MPI-PUGE-AT-0042]|nr:hypothetical protein BKA70DRAFT_1337978 [Coprinopsis sp. MPI-PUGE-AT-0042]
MSAQYYGRRAEDAREYRQSRRLPHFASNAFARKESGPSLSVRTKSYICPFPLLDHVVLCKVVFVPLKEPQSIAGKVRSEDEILGAIDHPDGETERTWTIDPNDRTKHFLFGEQHCHVVCVSFIVPP